MGARASRPTFRRRVRWIRLVLGLALLPALTAGAAPPNILFIVCDDLNTHVTPSGYSPIITPGLTRLAEQAMTFNRAYCQYPVCGPSRASFLTGLYPESTGVLNNTQDLRETRPGTVTLPAFLRQQGYWTAGVGKVFHSPRHDPGTAAWDKFVRFENDELPAVAEARRVFEAAHGSIEEGPNRKAWRNIRQSVAAPLTAQTPPGFGRSGLADDQHRDGKNVRQVSDWLRDRAYGDQPFFIACGIHKPHVPFLAPDKYFDLYPVDQLRYTLDPPDLWQHLPAAALSKRYQAFGFELGEENETRRRRYMQAYHACISFLDAQISFLLDAVEASGLWENTVVVFTSDHGYHLGDHFLWGKVTLFDIGTRVPFLVHVPGITTPGSRSEAMVELIDVFPTLAELAGLDAPPHLQGHSLVPILRDPAARGPRPFAYTVVSRGATLGYALRDQGRRYAQWPDGEELYDLRADPHERHNLIGDAEATARILELRARLAARRTLARESRR